MPKSVDEILDLVSQVNSGYTNTEAKQDIYSLLAEGVKDEEVILDPKDYRQTPEPEGRIIVGWNVANAAWRKMLKEKLNG